MAELQMMWFLKMKKNTCFLVFATLHQPFGVQLTLFLKSRAGSERNLCFGKFISDGSGLEFFGLGHAQ